MPDHPVWTTDYPAAPKNNITHPSAPLGCSQYRLYTLHPDHPIGYRYFVIGQQRQRISRCDIRNLRVEQCFHNELRLVHCVFQTE